MIKTLDEYRKIGCPEDYLKNGDQVEEHIYKKRTRSAGIRNKHRGKRNSDCLIDVIIKDLPVSSIVTDKKTKFSGKPIEWLVADHNYGENRTLLLSKDILCCRSFDNPKESYKDMNCREYGSNNWRDSDIRKWLETEFYRKSFSSRLAGLTIPVLNAPEIPMRDRGNRNEHMADTTEDNVFLLSAAEIGSEGDSEAIELFKGENKEKYRIAEVCPGLAWYWWLRSPYAGNSISARYVRKDGSLGSSDAYYEDLGVRPACVVSSSAPVKIRKSGGYKFDWKEADK